MELTAGGPGASLTTVETDVQKAARYREAVTVHLQAIIETMSEAEADGLRLSWAMSRDGYGRNTLMDVQVVRPL